MIRKAPFVPTHTLNHDVPELGMKAGTPIRQINPFAGGGKLDQIMCLTEDDWRHGREPWLFLPDDLDALECWPDERQKMIDAITKPSALQEAINKARGGPPPTPFQGFA